MGRESIQELSSLLQQQRGIRLQDYKDRWVERRLQGRFRVTRCADVGAYVEYVQQNPDEMERLLEALSISISSFFRNPEVFAAISNTVFATWRPAIQSGHRKLFRAWSCACAQGEEPYSLSALWEHWVSQNIPAEALPVDLKITASDVDAEALLGARSADYESSAMSDVPPYASASFELRNSRMVVRPRIRSRVQFVCENALAPARRPRVDLVLCRNFLIFLDRAGRETMMRIFEESLVPGGFLVLGSAETTLEAGGGSFKAVDLVHRIFQKDVGVNLK